MGVKLAADPDEAVARATDILGMDIKGHTVHKVMIAELSPEIEAEYYVSYLLDRTNRTFLAMASVQGGMDIEEVAEKTPRPSRRSRSTLSTGSTSSRPARSWPRRSSRPTWPRVSPRPW